MPVDLLILLEGGGGNRTEQYPALVFLLRLRQYFLCPCPWLEGQEDRSEASLLAILYPFFEGQQDMGGLP